MGAREHQVSQTEDVDSIAIAKKEHRNTTLIIEAIS